MPKARLADRSYDDLFVEDFIYNGKIAARLNAQGHANKTVCPECHIDDFQHVEGCSKLDLVANI